MIEVYQAAFYFFILCSVALSFYWIGQDHGHAKGFSEAEKVRKK